MNGQLSRLSCLCWVVVVCLLSLSSIKLIRVQTVAPQAISLKIMLPYHAGRSYKDLPIAHDLEFCEQLKCNEGNLTCAECPESAKLSCRAGSSPKFYFEGKCYNGLSAKYKVTNQHVRLGLTMDHVRPILTQAMNTIAPKGSIPKFERTETRYTNPCTTRMSWPLVKTWTDLVLSLPDNAKMITVVVPPPCNTDLSYAAFAIPSLGFDRTIKNRSMQSLKIGVLTAGTTSVPNLQFMGNTTMRCNVGAYTQWTGFMKMVDLYKWKHFAVLYDDREPTATRQAKGLIGRIVERSDLQVQSIIMSSDTKLEYVMSEASAAARVFIICNPSRLREFMVFAQTKEMTSGEYIFFAFDSLANSANGILKKEAKWNQNDTDSDIAKKAYRALFVFSVQEFSQSQSFQKLQTELKTQITTAKPSMRLSVLEPENFTMNYFGASYYDCLMVFAKAIKNASKDNGAGFDAKNLQKYMETYIAGKVIEDFDLISGKMRFRKNLDRQDSLSLLGLTDLTNGEFEEIGFYDAINDSFVPGAKMFWPTADGTPVKNKPECGFKNDEGPCSPEEKRRKLTLGLAIGLSIPGGILFLFLCYRWFKRYQVERAAERAWIARRRELQVFRDEKGAAPHESVAGDEYDKPGIDAPLNRTQKRAANSDAASSDDHQQSLDVKLTKYVSTWKGHSVTIRPSRKRRLKLNSTIKREVRTVRALNHEMIMNFRAVCLDDDYVMVIYDACGKGPLYDVLGDSNIKLEWAVRFSFVMDCAKGLAYLHNSPLKMHGRLSSMCCYIDSRFMLKIGDYGLNSFHEFDVAELWAAKREPDYYLLQLWKAPEHLRAEALSKYVVITSKSTKGDVYSFAIIVQEIVTRSKPFSMFALTDEMIYDAVKASASESSPRFTPKLDVETCPGEIAELCDRCWLIDPAKRPTMQSVRSQLRELGKQMGMGERSNIVDALITQMEEMENNLENIVEEKGRILQEQKNQSDQLLYSVLPEEIGEIMKRGDRTKAENYEAASVMHCDVPELNDLASETGALELIETLNELNEFFEKAIGTLLVRKFEFSKEHALFASGVPKRDREGHAAAIARYSLKLSYLIHKFRVRDRHEVRLSLRFGVHSGNVVAGVVGDMIPRYLIFGDTVAISKQMLSGGEKMKIQLSWATAQELERHGGFDVTERGEVFVKGKGAMKTFWLNGEPENDELDALLEVYEDYLENGTVKEHEMDEQA